MKIAIIGCGNMGQALSERLSSQNELNLYDKHIEKLQALEQKGFGKACSDLKEAASPCDMVIIAVKPQNLETLAPLLAPHLQQGCLLVSLLAGKSLDTLNDLFPQAKIIRLMPNLPMVHGKGVIGLAVNDNFPYDEKASLFQLFEFLGQVHWLSESKLDALSSLAGAGPAFIFIMVEAMVEAGIYMGLSAKEAMELIIQTFHGSLALMENTSKHPGELKWQVTSPKGMTIEGLKTLEELGLRASIMNGFISAYEKAKKLSND